MFTDHIYTYLFSTKLIGSKRVVLLNACSNYLGLYALHSKFIDNSRELIVLFGFWLQKRHADFCSPRKLIIIITPHGILSVLSSSFLLSNQVTMFVYKDTSVGQAQRKNQYLKWTLKKINLKVQLTSWRI